MKVRRTQYEIFWEILVFCKTPRTYTSIIHKCNLNSKITQEYLDFLTKKSYLSMKKDNDWMYYQTNPEAQEFLTLFSQMYQNLFQKTLQKKF
jgi:predicted transcriptional regulator